MDNIVSLRIRAVYFYAQNFTNHYYISVTDIFITNTYNMGKFIKRRQFIQRTNLITNSISFARLATLDQDGTTRSITYFKSIFAEMFMTLVNIKRKHWYFPLHVELSLAIIDITSNLLFVCLWGSKCESAHQHVFFFVTVYNFLLGPTQKSPCVFCLLNNVMKIYTILQTLECVTSM